MRRILLVVVAFVVAGMACGEENPTSTDGEGETITPPNAPTGPVQVYPDGVMRTYSTGGGASSLGHPLLYRFEWGDGEVSAWGNPDRDHAWYPPGLPHDYPVRTQARCAEHAHAVSEWSQTLTITVEQQLEKDPPNTSITSCPSGTIDYNTFDIEWTGTDNVTPQNVLEYSYFLEGLDAGWSPYATGTSRSVSGLGEGDYVFHVKARDEAGNEDPTPAIRSFTVALGGQCFITAVDPAAGVVWPDSTVQQITWSVTGAVAGVDIELYEAGAFAATIATGEFNDGSFDWLVHDADVGTSTKFQIKLINHDDPSCVGWSDEFVIDVPIRVDEITLNMPLTDLADEGGTHVLRKCLSAWNELTVTWDTKPDWDPSILVVGTRVDRPGTTRYMRFDIPPALVEAWISGSEPNHGLVITDNTPDNNPPGDTRITFRPRNYSADPPWVVITWHYAGLGGQTTTLELSKDAGVLSDSPDATWQNMLPSGWLWSGYGASYLKFELDLP